jgi:hypothetical protein
MPQGQTPAGAKDFLFSTVSKIDFGAQSASYTMSYNEYLELFPSK